MMLDRHCQRAQRAALRYTATPAQVVGFSRTRNRPETCHRSEAIGSAQACATNPRARPTHARKQSRRWAHSFTCRARPVLRAGRGRRGSWKQGKTLTLAVGERELAAEDGARRERRCVARQQAREAALHRTASTSKSARGTRGQQADTSGPGRIDKQLAASSIAGLRQPGMHPLGS